MRIALVVDNPHRDLPGLVLLGSRLAARGATVYLAPMNLQSEELSALAPDLAVLNCLRRTNQELAAALLAAGIRLALLDTEGGVMESTDLYGRVMADDPELRGRVSRVCFWGERLAGAVRRNAWYPAEAIRVTGAPRFDFYAPPWRRAAVARMAPRPELGEPLVLINSSFTLANPRFKTPEEESEMLAGRLGLAPEAVRRRLDAERAGLEGFLSLADRLPRRFPEVTFVYRPHPFERLDVYQPLVGRHRNLQVVAEGTVDGWLLRSSALIQLSSTTAVEAALAGVPSLSTDWLPTWHRLEPVESVSISCSSEASLDERLATLLEAGERPHPGPRAREVLRSWFHELDGRAHERVADELLDAAGEPGLSADASRCRRLHYRPERSGFRQSLAGHLRRTLRLPRSWSFRRMAVAGRAPRWDRSLKAYRLGIVEDWLRALASEATDLARISARPAEPGVDYLVPFPDGRSVVLENGH